MILIFYFSFSFSLLICKTSHPLLMIKTIFHMTLRLSMSILSSWRPDACTQNRIICLLLTWCSLWKSASMSKLILEEKMYSLLCLQCENLVRHHSYFILFIGEKYEKIQIFWLNHSLDELFVYFLVERGSRWARRHQQDSWEYDWTLNHD